jgi:DNA-binding NarL/FixJ family response regulator
METETTLNVLVIDDESWWPEQVRQELHSAGVRANVRHALTFQAGIELAQTYEATNKAPWDLVIIDRIMPDQAAEGRLLEERITPDNDKGTLAVIVLKLYGLLSNSCRILVATNNPSYKDCVEAIQAGASLYVPKKCPKPSLAERGMEYPNAVDVIREQALDILAEPAKCQANLDQVEAWLLTHGESLSKQYSGKWIALIDAELATLAGLQCDDTSGPVSILTGSDYQELAKRVLHPAILLRRRFPRIFRA